MKVILNQKWTDPRLAWNLTRYKDVEYIHVPIANIWQPDIILYNNIDGSFYPPLDDAWALVNYNGMVIWNPPTLFTSSCNMRVKQFPYDTQICTMFFKVTRLLPLTPKSDYFMKVKYKSPSQLLPLLPEK